MEAGRGGEVAGGHGLGVVGAEGSAERGGRGRRGRDGVVVKAGVRRRCVVWGAQ